MASVFRGPLLSSLRRRGTSAHLGATVAVNLLLTTLAIAPFSQDDWPNPQYKESYELGSVSGTIPQDVPFIPEDWPNPKAPRETDLGYVQGASAKDIPLPSDPPILPFDWPNPRTYRPLNVGFTQDVFRNPSDAGFPFGQLDWENPRGPRHKELGSVKGIRPPDEIPLSEAAWPNPRGRRPQNLGFTSDIFRNPADPGFPFSQDDWPNPKSAQPTDLGYVTQIRLSDPTRPFVQTEWKNPEVYRYFDPSYTKGIFLGSVPQVVTPFHQIDWPNPIQRVKQDVPLGHTSDVFRNPSPPGSPFSQKQWPLPFWPTPVVPSTFDSLGEHQSPKALLYGPQVITTGPPFSCNAFDPHAFWTECPDPGPSILDEEFDFGGTGPAVKRPRRSEARRAREEAIANRQAVEAAEREIKRIRDQNEVIAALSMMLIP